MTAKLDGRVVLVTGAAGGIGAALVERLFTEGARVAAVDIDDDALGRLGGPESHLLKLRCDVTSASDCQGAADECIRRFGQLDVLVNNAGVYPAQPFENISVDDWRKVMAINLDSAFLMARACVPAMKRREWGRIISLASGTVLLGTPLYAHYAAAKSGVVGLTRVLASEFGQFGITANVVSPGLTLTQRVLDHVSPELLERRRKERAIARDEQPADVVAVIVFLASDDAAFITGQLLNVDGGVVKH